MSHTHAQEHAHHEGESGDRNLLIALLLNVSITLAEVVGGIVSGSLSLLSDAVHNGSDAVSIGISYGARRIARRRADRERTFGYQRAEIIAALINLTTLFVIALFLIWEAGERLVNPRPVGGTTMLIIGAIAFVEDALSVYVLYNGSKQSLNIRSAFIHLVGDTLATLGVIGGGLLILFYDIYWVDPALTAAIAVYILVHGFIELRKAIHILMESAPEGFPFNEMVRGVEGIDGVMGIHHVHLWQLDEQRVAMEAHVTVQEEDLSGIERIKRRIKEMLHDEFDVGHATLEIELEGRAAHDQAVVADE